MHLRHDWEYYTKFVLFFILVFFVITYGYLHQETLSKEIEVITQGSAFFAKTTYKKLHLSQEEIGSDKETYEIEFLIHEQINEIRFENGLNELQWDPMLAEIARRHSNEMAQFEYLNHTNLFGMSPTDRAKEFGIKTRLYANGKIYDGIGENIGFMPRGIVQDVGVLITTEDVASAMVLEWMLSEPHKENILTEDYFFTGIGVTYDGNDNYYIVQNFQ